MAAGAIDAATDRGRPDRLVDQGVAAAVRPRRRRTSTRSITDLERWRDGGFGVPDFLDSLLAFRPERQRVDGLEHLVVFAMYTQNGNLDRNLEAVVVRVVWPDFVADVEATRYDNPMFVPISFVDFTAGYDTNSAVLVSRDRRGARDPDVHLGCDLLRPRSRSLPPRDCGRGRRPAAVAAAGRGAC